jgi:hypothetical protein
MKLMFISLIAAVVGFLWSFVSWTQLNWHQSLERSFQDESALVIALKQNAQEGRGVYTLPFKQPPVDVAEEEETKRLEADYLTAVKEGPYFHGVVRIGPSIWTFSEQCTWTLLRYWGMAILMGLIIQQLVMSYGWRISYGASIGILIALGADMPNWIWFDLPARDMIIAGADHFIEALLLSIVLATGLGKTPTIHEEDRAARQA